MNESFLYYMKSFSNVLWDLKLRVLGSNNLSTRKVKETQWDLEFQDERETNISVSLVPDIPGYTRAEAKDWHMRILHTNVALCIFVCPLLFCMMGSISTFSIHDTAYIVFLVAWNFFFLVSINQQARDIAPSICHPDRYPTSEHVGCHADAVDAPLK